MFSASHKAVVTVGPVSQFLIQQRQTRLDLKSPPPGDYCAIPQFADSVGPGESYTCYGNVAGVFRYDQCGIGCAAVEKDIDGDEMDTDNEIEFPGDPTETSEDVVEACCEPSIEAATGGEAEAEEACLSDCAHVACNRAISRFQALLDDPATDDACPTQNCRDRVKLSLEYFLGQIQSKFPNCVGEIAAGKPFNIGSPGCGEDIGCLKNGVLDVACTIDSVDFDSNSSTNTCGESLSQPPTASRQTCNEMIGEIMISDDYSSITSVILRGSATGALFDCGETFCPYVFEDFALSMDDVQSSGYDLTDLNVDIFAFVVGQSDGEDLEFPPGAFRVRVTGNNTDTNGTTAFTGYASSTTTVIGRHANDVMILDEVVFEAGGYTFTATIDSSECEDR